MKIVVLREDAKLGQPALIAEYESLVTFQEMDFTLFDKVCIVLIRDEQPLLLRGRWLTVATLAGKPIEYRLEFCEPGTSNTSPDSFVIRSTVIPI